VLDESFFHARVALTEEATMAYVIFDLDGTVIDSRHRSMINADGSTNLAHWFENNKPEKIALDTLLPLANTMRLLHKLGHHIIVCTARSWASSPEVKAAHEQFMLDNDLPYDVVLHREEGNMESDASLKVRLLGEYFSVFGLTIETSGATFFEDNLKVIEAMVARRVTCIDANKSNRRLAA
jgi:FMN phosphatase YigB (HAD superfamily)